VTIALHCILFFSDPNMRVDIFVVVNGVPSVGVPTMLGSGQIETQPTLPVALLPESNIVLASPKTQSKKKSGASRSVIVSAGHGHILALWTLIIWTFMAYA
jgi:hypothetical protein